jgi:ABC-type oligopeptide transport system substrate-binding subunit
MQSMSEGKADIYFLAMKSDLGDASSFFNDIASTTGSFNIGRYSNTQVDGLTDSASAEMDAKSRLMMLKEAMQIVVQNDPIGVPLFEYETIYAFRKNIYMEPRIDGFVHFDNLKIKK